MKARGLLGILVVLLLLGTVAPALAADTVARVVVVQTDDVAAYVKEIDKGRAMLKRLGSSGVLRVWQARFAGDATGSIVVAIEHPSLAALAADDAKMAADAEFQAWLKNLGKIRKVVSDSIYTELK